MIEQDSLLAEEFTDSFDLSSEQTSESIQVDSEEFYEYFDGLKMDVIHVDLFSSFLVCGALAASILFRGWHK